MNTSFSDYRKKYDKKIDQIEQLSKSYVIIGFQENSTTKSASKAGRKKEAGKSMAQIAAENEFGTKQIPARPFMSTAFDQNKEKINKAILAEYDKIVDGDSTIKKSLQLIGLLMKDFIQLRIRQIRTPPNSRKTIMEKKSSKPLIDFGQMIASVSYKIFIS